MPRPPDDEIPGFRAIQEEVERALRAAGVEAGSLDDAVMEGVRQALDALASAGLGLNPAPGEPGPEVTVMEGGRGVDDPPAEGEPPSLRVAEPAEGEDTPGPQVRIHLHRVEGAGQGGGVQGGVAIGRNGVISVEQGAVQTLFRGEQPRPYRLFCTAGQLEVQVDGFPVEALHKGQSIDVEARLVRVVGTSPARGHYRRLPE